MQTMPIEVRVRRIHRLDNDGKLKGFADIIVNDALLIKGLKIINGDRGLFVAMPHEKAKNNRWYEKIRCLTDEVREQVAECVLRAYEDAEGMNARAIS